MEKSKRDKAKFICVCATGSLYVYGLKFPFDDEDDQEIICTKLGNYDDHAAEIDPRKFLSQSMYTKKHYEMRVLWKDKDPLKITFAHDLHDEYQIMKTFLVIFNLYYTHNGDHHHLKSTKHRTFNRD